MAKRTNPQTSFTNEKIDKEIKHLYCDAIVRVYQSLKSINIALKLNRTKLKKKRPPQELVRLKKWRDALEYWKEQHTVRTQDPEVMAESLGIFYEICGQMT